MMELIQARRRIAVYRAIELVAMQSDATITIANIYCSDDMFRVLIIVMSR
jgi:hypothetical protein